MYSTVNATYTHRDPGTHTLSISHFVLSPWIISTKSHTKTPAQVLQSFQMSLKEQLIGNAAFHGHEWSTLEHHASCFLHQHDFH